MFRCAIFALLLHSLLITSALCSDSRQLTSEYVIVGGGPAGFVLATRLSQDPSITVTLLEAGGDGLNDPNVFTPAFDDNLAPSVYSFNYTTLPDQNRGNAQIAFAQGHCLGGGTSINYMTYCRGAASVYDEWSNLSGNSALQWSNVLKRSEELTNLTLPTDANYTFVSNTSVYGHGPLQVSFGALPASVEPEWGNAVAESVTQPVHIIDPNDGSGIGRINGGPHTIDLATGKRDSAQRAFREILQSRSNVQIWTESLATRINFNGTQAVSVDVFCETENKTYTLTASEEIILSAGAFGTPKLLMLSGIGPADQLQELGIPVLLAVPELGQNLYDHICATIMAQIPSSYVTNFELGINQTLLADLETQYTANGTGLLATPLLSTFITERPSNDTLDSLNASWHKNLPADRPVLLYQYVTQPLVPDPANVNVISAYVALIQPEASGSMRLASADFRDPPLIQPKIWGSEGDLAVMLYGYKTLRKAMRSSTLAGIVQKELYPGANVTSDEDLVRAMEGSASTFHHPVGTASLGKVTDGEFRIPGLRGLRVVDSSVIPVIPTCHIQASVYAVAEVAARVLIESRQVHGSGMVVD